MPDPYYEFVLKPCTVCEELTAIRCSNCQNAYFCKNHSQSDWPNHSEKCTTGNPPQPMRPSPPEGGYPTVEIQAYLHQPNEDEPRIVPVACTEVDEHHVPHGVQAHFEYAPSSFCLDISSKNGSDLECPLHIFYCPASLSTESSLNNAAQSTTGTINPKKQWYGPLLVMQFADSQKKTYTDVRSRICLSLVADVLRSWSDSHRRASNAQRQLL